MKVANKQIIKIHTLKISSVKPFSEEELNYIKALSYSISCFERIDKDNNILCLYLKNSNFLIADHTDGETINPIAFVDQNGDISFSVDISVFKNEIKNFKSYYDYNGSKNERLSWSNEKRLENAINEYKNDTLDFYLNNNVVTQQIIQQARLLYDPIERI